MNAARLVFVAALAIPCADAALEMGLVRAQGGPWGQAAGASAQQVSPPAAATEELGSEAALLREAVAALTDRDPPTARAKTAELIAALLATPREEQTARWLELLEAGGKTAWDAQDPRQASLAWAKALEIRSRELPEDAPEIQRARVSLGNCLSVLGNQEDAVTLYEQALAARSRTLSRDHPDLVAVKSNLGNALFESGEYERARVLREEVLEVRSRMLPDDDIELQRARGNLALSLGLQGAVDRERALHEKVLEVFSRTLPEDNAELQLARILMAGTLWDQGDLAGARTLQERALEVYARTLPPDHPHLQHARYDLARTLREQGDLAGARALDEQVLGVFSRTLPEDSPDLQVARNRVAEILFDQGDFAGARALEEKVLEVYAREGDQHRAEVELARTCLGATLFRQGDIEGARALQECAVRGLEQLVSANDARLGIARYGLARTLKVQGDLAAAIQLQEQILASASGASPGFHRLLQGTRAGLALMLAEFCAQHGREERVEARFQRVAEEFSRDLSEDASVALASPSAREAEERCANLLPDVGRAISFASGLSVFAPRAELDRAAFLAAETIRVAALVAAKLEHEASADPRYAALRAQVLSASETLAELAQQGASADELDAARRRREAAERDLVELARSLVGTRQSLLSTGATALASRLTERTAVIGFCSYDRLAVEADGRVRQQPGADLCAFVVRSGDRLTRIELGPIEPIRRAVESWRAAVGVRSERGASASPDPESRIVALGEELRRLALDPLLPALEGTDHLVIALDDELSLVPLDALPAAVDRPEADFSAQSGDSVLLGDRWRIETRSTLAELLDDDARAARSGGLVALGHPAFDRAPAREGASQPEADELAIAAARSTQGAGILRGGLWERGFSTLPETSTEVRAIADYFAEEFGAGVERHVLERARASRENLIALAPKARWLHVATHGWFAPESIRALGDPDPLDEELGIGTRLSGIEQVKGMNPMLLCGLAFAGANLSVDAVGRIPGLVTAEELSTLELSGCELAVLSACDTNVGERRAGQGVASLQKALQMAGARSVITSLWKVPDEATRVLMVDFYRRIWVEKEPKHQALWEAKSRLRRAKDSSGKPLYTTRDWAAWVLTGAPE